MVPLYNAAGHQVVYADEECYALYDAKGNVVAWFDKELIYSAQGRYLGWAHQGWVYDRNGHPALFAENAIGGLERPRLNNLARLVPKKISLTPLPTPLPERQPRPARRNRATSWSSCSGAAYFSQ